MDYIDSNPSGRSILLDAEPQLFVTNVAIATDYYTQKLGFEIVFLHGEPPSYGQVSRDQVRLNLRGVLEPVIATDIQSREDLLSASITVDNVHRLFNEYVKAGVTFHQTMQTESWGAQTFIVRDPDGNLILFAGNDLTKA
jgi:uncharacterized glyoxalase superfamily protein PhnB